jgi:hypothetical protein
MEKFRGYDKVGFQYSRALGGRSQAAGVFICFSANDTYSFISMVDWPEAVFREAVERGVRAGLIESGYDPDLGVEVRIEKIEYDPVNSSEIAFYKAARYASKASKALTEWSVGME